MESSPTDVLTVGNNFLMHSASCFINGFVFQVICEKPLCTKDFTKECKYTMSQSGKSKEVKERDKFDAVEDFKPAGVPWRCRLIFAFTVKFYGVKQVQLRSFSLP